MCFQWVDTLASKQAKGMSLRYDVICTLGIGDVALYTLHTQIIASPVQKVGGEGCKKKAASLGETASNSFAYRLD